MSFTFNEWVILALVLVFGWVLGLLSRSGGKRWRRAYEEERTAHAALRADHDAFRGDQDTRTRAANTRITDLERHEPGVGAGTAGGIAAAASGRRDDLSRIHGLNRAEETRLNDAGIYSYRDIASMTPEQEAGLEARLGYERGRIASERWREQADALAHGRSAASPTSTTTTTTTNAPLTDRQI